jgi:hypothetical protein
VPCLPDDVAAYFQAFYHCGLFNFCPCISFTNIITEFSDNAGMRKVAVWLSDMLRIRMLDVLKLCLPANNKQGLKFCQ